MKKFFVTVFVVTLVFGFTGITNVYATPINITIPDLMGSGTGWHGAQEDQEVEPGCVIGQEWDLEAFGFDSATNELFMVGGYDFVNGEGGWDSGDIFIDVTGDAKYGPGNDGSGSVQSGNSTVANTFGYDYVLDMNFSNLTYDVYAIDSTAQVETVYYSLNQESNPWRYESGGSSIGGGSIGYQTGLPNDYFDPYYFEGGSHNLVTVDLGWLMPISNSFTTHFTMECGNDNLMGHYDPIPEPGTLLLLGAGLIGLLALGRKRLNK